MASTINDVAKLAGVSRQTVSRVLNEPGRVNPDTLQNVKRAIEKLDYHPNITARNLANNIVKTVGLFMPFGVAEVRQNLFFSTLSATVCHHFADKDFVLQLFTSLDEEDYGSLFKRLYREKRVGGLILTCPSVNNQQIVELLAARIPFVLVGRPGVELEGASYVDVDNAEAADRLFSYLLELGHQRIGFLNAPPSLTLAVDLSEGIDRARKRWAERSELIEEHSGLTLEYGYEAAKRMLSAPDRPTAIMAADDLLIMGAAKAAEELGLSIPGDLSIASAVKNGWGDLLPIPLTYIDTQFEKLGGISAAYIIDQISGEPTQQLRCVLPVQLVEGQSCRRL